MADTNNTRNLAAIRTRLAEARAELAEILDTLSDSEPQELAYFERVAIPELKTEIAALEVAEEKALARNAWDRSDKAIRKAAWSLRVVDGVDRAAVVAEGRRLLAKADAAQERAFARGADVNEAHDALRAEIIASRDNALFAVQSRLAFRAERRAPVERSALDQQLHNDLRLAGFAV